MRFGQVRVVIPMKPLAESKQRLAGVLAAEQRARLSLWMLERVLRAAGGARLGGEVVVVGGDHAVAGLCRSAGVRWAPDRAAGLNATLQGALAAAGADGVPALLYLAGDLPYLESHAIGGILDASASAQLVLCPGLRGGTNAILVSSDAPFRFQLGRESFASHVEQALALGAPWVTWRSPGIEADVDLPEDLAGLERCWPDLWQRVIDGGGSENGSRPLLKERSWQTG